MMKTKRIFALMITMILLSVTLAAVPASASESSDEYRLFKMTGESYVSEIPFTNQYNTVVPNRLRGTGEDTVWTLDGKVITLDNSAGKNSVQYYVCGTNSLDYLKNHSTDLVDYLDEYVVEYEMIYQSDIGHVSIMLNYNYYYNIDVFINPDGTGDIRLNYYEGEEVKSVSVLRNGGKLKADGGGSELIHSLFGDEADSFINRKINVSVRVSADENKVPVSIDVYINGKYVASEDSSMGGLLENVTVKFDTDLFDQNELGACLGYVTALNCSQGSKATVENVRIYTVKESAMTPIASALEVYASHYGNLSFDPSLEYDTDEDGEVVTDEAGESVTLPVQTDSTDASDSESNTESDEVSTGNETESEIESNSDIEVGSDTAVSTENGNETENSSDNSLENGSEINSESEENTTAAESNSDTEASVTRAEPTPKPLIIFVSLLGAVTLAFIVIALIMIFVNKNRIV